MYLARRRLKHTTHYSIRLSYAAQEGYESRELFDLGTEPGNFIIYPGGTGYYYDPIIEDTLSQEGVKTDQAALDDIFLEFLRPDIQRVIAGFDRHDQHRNERQTTTEKDSPAPVHIFDRSRYHYLRFGYSDQRYIHLVSDKIFRTLHEKSRDELEHYFWQQERHLAANEMPIYVAIIFRLHHWSPQVASNRSWRDQMDDYFNHQLCHLNADREFMAGVPQYSGLSAYLIRYAVTYYDDEPPKRSAEQEYIRDFINRHRVHHPPASIQVKKKEAENLFGRTWRELKKMNRAQLTKAYRRLALKYHPDQGGDSETFGRLSQYYEALLQGKPRN